MHSAQRTSSVAGSNCQTSTANPDTLVIGVVGHVRHWGLAGDDQSRIRDQIYYPFAQVPDHLMRFFSSVMSLAVRTQGAPAAMINPLRQRLRGGAGDQMLYALGHHGPTRRRISDSQRFLLLLFGIFAGLALLLACISIYGVILTYQPAHPRNRRPHGTGRIGVRSYSPDPPPKPHDDSPWRRCRLARLAFAAARLLHRFVEGMQPAEPMTFAAMIIVLFATALLASYIPARRASHTNPGRTLRQD